MQTATNPFESMSEAHRYDMAAAWALRQLKATGKPFTQKELLAKTEKKFQENEARLSSQ